MKICFVGLGSIGKRHLKNIHSVSKEMNFDISVDALRSGKGKNSEEIEKLIDTNFYSIDDLKSDYDIVFITNPTALHYDAIKSISNKTKHMFIEKPVFESTEYNIEDLGLNKKGVYYIAAPMRYTNVMNYIKKFVGENRVYSVRNICSTYLPEWRKGIDYRNVYSAKKELGGGISLDCIHEWDYLIYLFGYPEQVYNIQGKYSHLEIDSDDLSIYIAQYKDKLVELHLDYFGRVPKREIELYTENGTVTGDFIKNEIRFTDGRDIVVFENDDDEIYIRELKKFMAMIVNGEKNENDIYKGFKTLKIAKGEE